MQGATGKIDWAQSWLVGAVTPAEWDELRESLRRTYEAFAERLRAVEHWGDEEVGDSLAILVHTAYHLGAIRQLARLERVGRRARTNGRRYRMPAKVARGGVNVLSSMWSNQSDELKFCKACGANLSAVRLAVASRGGRRSTGARPGWPRCSPPARSRQRQAEIERLQGLTPEVKRYNEIKGA